MHNKSIWFVHGSVKENKVTFNFYGFHHKVLNCGSDDDINKVKWIRVVLHVSFFVMCVLTNSLMGLSYPTCAALERNKVSIPHQTILDEAPPIFNESYHSQA